MGYTTEFEGSFAITPSLSEAQARYLQKWGDCRRMRRSTALAAKIPDPLRVAVDLPLGTDAEFFSAGSGFAGQDRDQSVIDYNQPPSTQPGLWCQWRPSDDGSMLAWDGSEKFYSYVEWLNYLIANFFKRWERKLNGTVTWQGEESGDIGQIVVKDNVVSIRHGKVVFEEPSPSLDVTALAESLCDWTDTRAIKFSEATPIVAFNLVARHFWEGFTCALHGLGLSKEEIIEQLQSDDMRPFFKEYGEELQSLGRILGSRYRMEYVPKK